MYRGVSRIYFAIYIITTANIAGLARRSTLDEYTRGVMIPLEYISDGEEEEEETKTDER